MGWAEYSVRHFHFSGYIVFEMLIPRWVCRLIHQLMDYANELRATSTSAGTSAPSSSALGDSTFLPSAHWLPPAPAAQSLPLPPRARTESSPSSSPASYSPPTPPSHVLSAGVASPKREEGEGEEMGVEQWEAMVLDRQMEERRAEALALRRAQQQQTQAMILPVPATPSIVAPTPEADSQSFSSPPLPLSLPTPPPPSPLATTRLGPARPSRMRAASAESALSAMRMKRGMSCLLEDDEEGP